MIDLKQLQKQAYANKVAKGFNVTDIPLEFGYTYGELAEAFDAYRKKTGKVWEELADVLIYLLGLSEILWVDLEAELLAKMDRNKKREYETIDGVLKRTKDA